MTRRHVGLPTVVAGLLLLAACGSGREEGGRDPRPRPAPVVLEAVTGGAVETVPSALDDASDPRLPKPLVDPLRIVSGGPPPDGIPAIDRPKFERAGDVGWLTDAEAVLALTVGDHARAYPVQVLIWHEIVNDTVGGTPVAVTYCPLCNSALAFDRRVGDRLLTFGTSGRLYLSDLVMYDRQTRSLWPQLEGRAVAGLLTGTELDRLPVATVSWAQWRAGHPDDWVLSRDTGVTRDYGRNPYVGYDDPDADPFLFDGAPDRRLPPKERVLGLGGAVDPVAVPLRRLAERRVVDLDVDGRPVVAWAAAGLRSALDTKEVDGGREIAATGAFSPVVDGRRLRFTGAGADRFTDAETGSTWTVLGQAVAGPLTGRSLEPVQHVDTFWFAWAAFRPDTRVAG